CRGNSCRWPPAPCLRALSPGLVRGEEVRPELFHEPRWGRVIVPLARQSFACPQTRLRLTSAMAAASAATSRVGRTVRTLSRVPRSIGSPLPDAALLVRRLASRLFPPPTPG